MYLLSPDRRTDTTRQMTSAERLGFNVCVAPFWVLRCLTCRERTDRRTDSGQTEVLDTRDGWTEVMDMRNGRKMDRTDGKQMDHLLGFVCPVAHGSMVRFFNLYSISILGCVHRPSVLYRTLPINSLLWLCSHILCLCLRPGEGFVLI